MTNFLTKVTQKYGDFALWATLQNITFDKKLQWQLCVKTSGHTGCKKELLSGAWQSLVCIQFQEKFEIINANLRIDHCN